MLKELIYYWRQVNRVNGGVTVFVRCVSVCVSLCTVDQSIRPVWVLNAYSSKMVRATDFKFDMHVSGDSPGHNPLKFSRKGGIARIMWPLNFWVLNANSSKKVKPMEFKFDVLVYFIINWQSHKNAFKLLFCKKSLGGDMHSHERLLVKLCDLERNRQDVSVLWYCWLGDMKGIQPAKICCSNPQRFPLPVA